MHTASSYSEQRASERANERNSERVTLFWLQLFNKSISPQMHGLGIFQQ
jgi:hypothetical protein